MGDSVVSKWLLVLAGMMIAGPALAGDVPLLKNASFEVPIDPENWVCDQPAYWIRWGNWMNRETAWAPTHSGECLVGFHHFRLLGEDNAGFYQDVRDVQHGRKYTFRIYTWVDKDTNAEFVELQLHSYHGGSKLTNAVFKLSRIEKDKWVPLSITGSPPDDGLRVMVIAAPRAGGKFCKGAIKFDDAELVRED